MKLIIVEKKEDKEENKKIEEKMNKHKEGIQKSKGSESPSRNLIQTSTSHSYNSPTQNRSTQYTGLSPSPKKKGTVPEDKNFFEYVIVEINNVYHLVEKKIIESGINEKINDFGLETKKSLEKTKIDLELFGKDAENYINKAISDTKKVYII